ncbi:PQQ-binding-like beta-propeller repeat protein [Psychromarinibacter sp. C21-152]|uniref:PQQ-binding-like beta-propeller repeat protein n=1 Tax=Psychromarinibacter sediminicola TaxID=3033385 RepID=A0AAE3NPZ6_9RHOB|nr:PQQ-like beta-propeller repeat protein [Psychromarinibacter sediminicola]MDF0601393.1 PQQ-binding-like beta-propeller repeat protein [Psychromarinibacter sediminicola]
MTRTIGLAAGLGVLLAACGERETILPGERLDIRSGATVGEAAQSEPEAPVDRAFSAPAPVSVASWTHRAGNPSHSIPHAALSPQPSRIWSADIGDGNSRKHRITADPIVAAGRVFTLDSRSMAAATSTSGERLWTRSLVPESDREGDASGGGIAFGGGKVFVTTGFGEVHALDPATGAEIWVQNLDAPATASPTVVGGLLYVISRDNVAWAIDTATGRVRWRVQGTPSVSGMIGGAGPAVTDKYAIFPFASGELIAALRQGGVRVWGATVSGGRKGAAYANITDIVADPVVSDGVLYTGNQSGRAVALDLESGERIWTAEDGAYGPVWVAGGSVFLVSDQAELIRLDAATGQVIWSQELPYFKANRVKRRKSIYAYFGPVLAGGQLWVASDDGKLRAFDPASGALRQAIDIPGGAASNISVAGGTMYVVSENGQLHAFR